MTTRRITRDRRLTPEEAARYDNIRKQVASELPKLIERHHARTAFLDELQDVVNQWPSARQGDRR